MSDQNVVTDWRAYFARLGPGTPFSPEKLAAMRDKDPRLVLIMDEAPGQLMSRHVLGDEPLDEALERWEGCGKPRAWLTLGELIWWCDAASLPSRDKVRSRS
jgi:hypothetical protein